MSKATINRFLTILSSVKDLERVQLYQLLEKAESCYCLKDRRGQYEFGRALSLFPPPFNLVGDYYQSAYLHRQGQKELAYEKLERVREEVEGTYKDKATLTLSGLKEVDNDPDESFKIRLGLQRSESLPVVVESTIGISSLLSAEGRHDKALRQLESVLPLLEKVGMTPLFYDVLNSYAVELAETGKFDQASQVITPVLVSPYIKSYPNWLETAEEIQQKSRRSVVSFNNSNVIEFPMSDKVQESSSPREPITYPFSDYLETEFRMNEKVEDWIHGGTEPDDFGTLVIALYESNDEDERTMILSRLLESTFIHTEEGKEAKGRWEKKLLSKIIK